MRNERSTVDPLIDIATGAPTGWKTVLMLLLISLLGLGAGAWFQAAANRQSSLDDPVQTVALATLGDREPPTGHVQLTGAAIDQARAQIETRKRRRGGTRYTMWAPVTVEGAVTTAAPIRIFYRRWKLTEAELPLTMRVLGGRYEGVMARDALPAEAVEQFRASGVTVASPHYVLDENGDIASEDDEFWAIGGFALGGVALFITLLAAVQKTRGKPMALW